jgi:SH3-like domain-containing protein
MTALEVCDQGNIWFSTKRVAIKTKPNKQTKMYLLKDDIVEIIEEKEDWLHIRYYSKKVVEGWIKKSDVE